MGRYLDLTRVIAYEFNEFNEVNILDDKKLLLRNEQVTNLIPPLEQGAEDAGIKFVTSPDSTPKKTLSQTFNSLNSLNSYCKAFPDLSSDHHRILERLPNSLERMVRAASNDALPTGPAKLPSGLVVNLNGYVVYWACSYITGDGREASRRLLEAYTALHGGKA